MSTDEQRPDACTFCAELLGLLEKSNYGRLAGKGATDRILWRGEHFALIPSLGPLCAGHLLLVPTQHVLSFANLTELALLQAEELIASIGEFFNQQQDVVLAFEHGAITLDDSEYERRLKRAKSGACTDHAHVHLLPGVSAQEVISTIDEMCPHKRKSEITHLQELRKELDPDMAYIIISDEGRQGWCVYQLEKVPRQFMRRVLASIIGLAEWDWYDHPHIEVVQRTVKELGPKVKEWLDRAPRGN